MGYIKSDVLNNTTLAQDDLTIAKYFTTGFNVNYGDSYNEANTNIIVFILEPEDYLKEGFGLEKEVALVISHFENMESRTIRAVEQLFSKYPFRNRVDNLCYFLVSKDENVENWLKRFYDSSINSQIVFPFSIQELLDNKGNQWYIRDKLRKYSFDKDLFGYTLPLQDDSSFFGRQQILGRYIDAIKRCQNRGIFGLRKTGKTSLLLKIRRTVVEQKIGHIFLYDCKNPQVRKKRWYELLNDISYSLAGRLGLKNFICKNTPLGSIESFRYLMKKATENQKKIILVFDEIEYISYFAKQDKHWQEDYFEFWQTLWSEQSTFANLCFIICGVNAYVTERDTIEGIQNPLFGIIQSEYLTGLSLDETITMIKTLGRRMGLKFERDAVQFLFDQYGGHPMLTRLACSWLNRYLDGQRPITIYKKTVEEFQNDIDLDPSFYSYFGHIVSEIKQFYPDEYAMLEILASGQTSDFIELSETNEFIQHLNAYGLISYKNHIPQISLPVAGRYIALELAKREKRKSKFKLITLDQREKWLNHRINVIIEMMRDFEKNIRLCKKPELYGINSFSEAEKLKQIPVAKDSFTFEIFINTMYKCFVESVKNFGDSIGNRQYFQNQITINYPMLSRTFDKISEYRNERDHILLTDYHKQKLDMYRMEDLENYESNSEKYFCLQQKIVIELITNIYSESLDLE